MRYAFIEERRGHGLQVQSRDRCHECEAASALLSALMIRSPQMKFVNSHSSGAGNSRAIALNPTSGRRPGEANLGMA